MENVGKFFLQKDPKAGDGPAQDAPAQAVASAPDSTVRAGSGQEAGKAESRSGLIARGEREGWLVPGCPGCVERYQAPDPLKVFGPHHKASARCESGKRPHCTCDTCF